MQLTNIDVQFCVFQFRGIFYIAKYLKFKLAGNLRVQSSLSWILYPLFYFALTKLHRPG